MTDDCLHLNLKTTLTPELQHHGRLDCLDCGRFVGWIKKPETVVRDDENTNKMKRLMSLLDKLDDWERGFVESVQRQMPKISPKQQVIVDRIFKKTQRLV